MKRFDIFSGNVVWLPDGAYCVYSQAAAVIQLANEKATSAEQRAATLQRQLEETRVLLAEGADLVRDQAAEIARLNDGWDEMQRQLADALAERDAWKGIHDGQQRVYTDIGTNLGADMPRELVNEVARRRMAELAAARALVSELDMTRYELPEEARFAIEAYRQKYPEGEQE